MDRFIFLLFVTLCVSNYSFAQDKKINFPEVDGYKVLVCDPHIHSVFSDGGVWPTIRVEEGIREGLDVVSITDHQQESRQVTTGVLTKISMPQQQMGYIPAHLPANL